MTRIQHFILVGAAGLVPLMGWGRIAEADNAAPASSTESASRAIEDGGTGAYKALMVSDDTLPTHTIFRPRDLGALNEKVKLPIVAWGNGACANSPWEHVKFLSEVASHGFLVIAIGPMPGEGQRGAAGGPTKSPMLMDAITWAIAQNSDKSSQYYQRLDTNKIAAAGMSCGGLQALEVARDPRISTVIVCNSGILGGPGRGMPGMPNLTKDHLANLHAPLLYILGGEKDIAYNNGMDDFRRINHLPIVAASLNVGHGGTYSKPHGGEFAKVATAWLKWQLKGDKEAAKMFVGDPCELAKVEGWKVEKKNIDGTASRGVLLGADVSFLANGRGGSQRLNRVYRDSGKTNEEWRILMDHGWRVFRLRVFVSPVRSAPNNTIENTIPLAKRIKAAGGQLLLCLHLSDTWADPKHQDIPIAWRDLDFAGLEKAVEAHCLDVVKQLKEAGAMPDWVQVGNEITYGTLWPIARVKRVGATESASAEPSEDAKQWEHLTRILKAGIRGVKTAAGDTQPRIAIHIDKGANWEVSKWFFDHITDAKVEYDIIAQSFYPPWGHGTLEQVWENMNESAKRYNKDFAVVETGYGKAQRESAIPTMKWPQTPEGRLQFMADLINTVNAAPRGTAVMYWAPEWDLWNTDGTPAPAVSVLDHLTTLTNRPASQAPTAVFP